MASRWKKLVSKRTTSDIDCAVLEAERQPVTIVPNFDIEQLKLISCDLGPFKAGQPVDVPLWMAMLLKQEKRCRINPPQWMAVDHLEAHLTKEQEKGTENTFAKFAVDDMRKGHCFHYREIAKILLSKAPEDFDASKGFDVDKVRTLVKDISEVRNNKMRHGLKGVDERVSTVEENNISAIEVGAVRRFICQAMDTFYQLHKAQVSAEDGQTQSGSGTQRGMADPHGAEDVPVAEPEGAVRKIRRWAR